VACFAYELPVSMVDTNVRRVIGRVFGASASELDALAEQLVPADDAYPWNQALMDLGATLCSARKPLCLVCPLVGLCGGPSAPLPKRPAAGEFRGSTRQLRGRAVDTLRGLAEGESMSLNELVARTGASKPLIERLALDGLVQVTDGRVALLT
jgi:A/G-specific adenine glycosylase